MGFKNIEQLSDHSVPENMEIFRRLKKDYPSKKLKRGQYYEVPYRALVTNEISNLLVVGRCASSSFTAQASFRIQPTCMSMGEAADIAVAWGLSHGVAVNDLRWEDISADVRSYVSEG